MNIYEGLQLIREVGTMYTVAVMLPITGEGVAHGLEERKILNVR